MFIQSPTLTRAAAESMSRAGSGRHRLVVVGRGAGVEKLVRALGSGPVDVAVVDPATQRVQAVDTSRRMVALNEPTRLEVPYDTLVVATGTEIRFGGSEGWEVFSGADDLGVESRVRMASEFADSEPDPAERTRLLTFVVVGGGAAEVAVAIAIAAKAREIVGEGARIVLAAPALLPGLPAHSRTRQAQALQDWGVEIRLGAVAPLESGVSVDGARIEAGTVAWAAGVTAAEAARWVGTIPPKSVHLVRDGRDGARVAEAVLRRVDRRPVRNSALLTLELVAGDVLAWLRSEWRAALS